MMIVSQAYSMGRSAKVSFRENGVQLAVGELFLLIFYCKDFRIDGRRDKQWLLGLSMAPGRSCLSLSTGMWEIEKFDKCSGEAVGNIGFLFFVIPCVGSIRIC
jgi:hypothetical protein